MNKIIHNLLKTYNKTLTKKNLNILYGEDTTSDEMMFREALKTNGFDVSRVTHFKYSQDITDYLKKTPAEDLPDVIVMDFTLPFVSGLNILGWIRTKREYDHIPVFIYTGSDYEENRENFEKICYPSDRYFIKETRAMNVLNSILEFIDTGRIEPGVVDISKEEVDMMTPLRIKVKTDDTCKLCHRPYRKHLRVSYEGKEIPTLHIDCLGQHVTL